MSSIKASGESAPVAAYAIQGYCPSCDEEKQAYRGRFFAGYASNPHSVLSWRFQREHAGLGTLGDLMSHVIDMAHMIAGPVKRVSAFSKKILRAGSIDDVTAVILEFESGPLGYIGFSLVLPKICVTFAFGTDACAWAEEEGAKLYFQKVDQQAREELPVEGGDALADEMAEFARCIRDGGAPETGGPEGIEVVAVQEAVIESAASGRIVEVADYR